jgi:hypothetical protein
MAQKFDMQRFVLLKLNSAEVGEQYQVKTLKKFAVVNINRTWEHIRKNIKISVKESPGHYKVNQHKPWFDEVCSKL